jgi:hypothetical protein
MSEYVWQVQFHKVTLLGTTRREYIVVWVVVVPVAFPVQCEDVGIGVIQRCRERADERLIALFLSPRSREDIAAGVKTLNPCASPAARPSRRPSSEC